MTVLSRPKLYAQERLDLEDLNLLFSGLKADSKYHTKQFWSDAQYVLKGFAVSGLGGPSPATVSTTNATLVNANNTGDFSWFTSEIGSSPLSAVLNAGTRNYLELELSYADGTPLTRAFWDPSANGGLGAEFNQTVNTQTAIEVDVVVLTGGFSGSTNRIPLAIVDTNGSNTVQMILDKRPMYFRLGTPSNSNNSYSWASQLEPSVTLTMSGVSGSFVAGETVTINGAVTATVLTGGSSPINIIDRSSDNISVGHSVVGNSSGATGTITTAVEAFSGADKSIHDLKTAYDALTSEIKALKGTPKWFQAGFGSIYAAGSYLNSVIAPNTAGAKISWSGTAVSITDADVTPADADVVAKLRLFGRNQELNLTRQDGTGGSTTLTLADDEVLYIDVPTTGDRTYDAAGSGSTNYKKASRVLFANTDSNYWLAYRVGTRLMVRGLGELESGESHEIGDETPDALATLLGFDPETALTVPYAAFPNGTLPASFVNTDSLVTAISANTENINFIDDILNENPYEELQLVVSGAPANDNEVTGPVLAGTILTLPLDSRDSNNPETYIVGRGQLMLFLNGVYLAVGDDWDEVGANGSSSDEIEILIELDVGDRLTYRNALAAGIFGSGGVGTTTLQDAYDNGTTITTNNSDGPFTVGGTATKVAQFNGDIGVTGVIDPLGIEFERTASNPLGSGKDGFWVNNSGELVYRQDGVGDVNFSQDIGGGGGGSAEATEVELENFTGLTIDKLSPVRINASGQLDSIDVSVEAEAFSVIGIASENIADSTSGTVVTDGKIENVTTVAALGDVLYVAKDGTVTNTKPSIGSGGFVAGDFVIRLGVISKNVTNGMQKDLIVNVSIVGQL